MYLQYETTRLILKVLDEKYSKDVLNFYYEGESYFGGMEPARNEKFFTEKYQRLSLKYEMENFLSEKSARYYIFAKAYPNTIIGTVSLRNMVKGNFHSCTIGYKMRLEYTRRGLCTEAVRCLTEAAIRDNGIHRIVAYVQPNNIASIKVLKHCGYECEGIARQYVKLRGKWHDHAVYSRIAGE